MAKVKSKHGSGGVGDTPKPNVADAAAALSGMLNQPPAPSSNVNVDAEIPSKQIAGGKATWTGIMTLPNGQGGELVKFAVKACKAIDDEKFERHMYHSAECLNRVNRADMICSGCGVKGLNQYNTVKGVESDGKVVLISDEELAALVPQNEKTMHITEYVDGSEIDPIYFEETEFLYPQQEKKTNAAQMTFAALGAMLREEGLVAKGVRVKRGKEQYFVVRPFGNHGMSINILRAEYEVRDASGLWESVDAPREVVELLKTVAEPDKKAFTPAKRDQYLANANRLVASKKAGVVPDCPTPEPERKGTDDLLSALKAAVAAKAAAAGK